MRFSFFLIIILSYLFATAQNKESNSFDTLTIGNKVWMNENLSNKTFRNGDIIPEATSREEWISFNASYKPAYCHYDFSSSNEAKYGLFYNFYAVIDSRGLAPLGWEVPTNKDWDDFQKVNKYRAFPPTFNVNFGGQIDNEGEFRYVGRKSFWWTKTRNNVSNGIRDVMLGVVRTSEIEDSLIVNLYTTPNGFRQSFNGELPSYGMNVRCIKDENSLNIVNPSNQQSWIKKGITKIQKQNAYTNQFEDIILMNPGKYIHIRNDKDVLIEDLDVFRVVFGDDFVGFYQTGEFTSGEKTNTSVEQTVAYKGDLVLRNTSNGQVRKGETYIFFYYSGSKLGAIEIRTRICNCATRIYIDDYKGVTILN